MKLPRIFDIKIKNRAIPVIAGALIQMCLGTAYIWSVFQTGVANYLFSGNNANAALTFSLLLAILSVGSAFGGKIQDKIGPSPVIVSGGIILALGFFLSSLVKPSAPWVIWLTYGGLGGLGMGFIYSTTIACCQKWFPDKRGLISGIIVSALGFGGVIFTPIAESLIKILGKNVQGVGELKTFALLALIFLVICTLGGLFIVNPPSGYKPKGWTPPAQQSGVTIKQYTPLEMLKTPNYYLITLTLMLACMAGLMMIGFAKPISQAKGISANVAAVGVMIISIFNSFGRLFWGWVSDKVGRKQTVLILLILTAVIIPFVTFTKGYMILVLIGVIGFSYGGFLGTFPALTADYFGTKNMGSNYGFVLVGFGIGAVASSYIAGYFRDKATQAGDISKMLPAFIFAAAAAAVGIALIMLLKQPKVKDDGKNN
ncbi:MAG: OFA family MFS transporter [Clostridiales bacterium]|nr:OFA family MFS transporter [Clostridiales bacterium]